MSPSRIATEPRVKPEARFVTFVRRSATYALGPAAGRALGLILVPFVFAGLGADDFGRYEILSTAGSAIASVFFLGMDLSSISLYRRPEGRDSSAVFPTALVVGAGSGLLAIAAVFLFKSELGDSFNDSHDFSISLVGVYAALTVLALVALAGLRAEDMAARHATATFAAAMGTAVLTLAAVLAGATLDRIMLAQVGGAMVGAMVGLWLARDRVVGRIDRRVAVSLAVLGLPQLLATISQWSGEVGHRLLLLRAAGPSEVGLLGVGARIGWALVYVVLAVQAALHPRIFSHLESARGVEQVERDVRRVSALMCLAAIALSLVAPFVIDLMSRNTYDDAGRVGGWLIASAVGVGVLQLSTLYTVIYRRFGDLAIVTAFGTVSGLVVSAFLADSYGATGVAAAMAVGSWASALAGFVVARLRDLLRLAARPILFPALLAIPSILAITSGYWTWLSVSLVAVSVTFCLCVLAIETRRGAAQLHEEPIR